MINDGLHIKGRVVTRTYSAYLGQKIKRLFEQGKTAEQISEIMPAEAEVVSNMVVTEGKQLIFQLLANLTTTGIKYLGIGTGTTPPALTDSQLVAESFRKLITSYSYDGTTLYVDTFVAAAEANITWQEVALFGNSSASGTANSGDVMARALLNQTKTSTQTKTVSWQISLI